MAVTATTICTDALIEVGALAGGETANSDDLAYAFEKLVRLFDTWNAIREAVYATTFTNYTSTPNLSPHTIGPTGTFVVAVRPVSIEGASLRVLTPTPVVQIPLNLRDKDWWRDQRVQTLTSGYPTDVWYQPSWPDGSLWLWPVPTTAHGLQIATRVLLAALALTDTFTMPPGYRDAVTYTLAETLTNFAVTDATRGLAARARAVAFGNNHRPVRLQTQDAGMPSGRSSGRSSWDYLTGEGT